MVNFTEDAGIKNSTERISDVDNVDNLVDKSKFYVETGIFICLQNVSKIKTYPHIFSSENGGKKCGYVENFLFEKLFTYIYNISGTHGYQQITV